MTHTIMKKIRHIDLVFMGCCVFTLMLAMSAIYWNTSHQHYYLDFQWLGGTLSCWILAFFVAVYFLCVFWHNASLFAAVSKSIAMLYLTLCIMELCNTAILTTPFPTHDHLVRHMDQLLGFHELSMLRAVHNYSSIQQLIWNCYFSLLGVIHFLPISLTVAENPERSYHYYCSFIISIILGYSCYYFFPTMTSPAAIYPHQYFTSFQINTLHQFQLEHLHKIIHFNLVGGIISFPSFHAIWAVFVIYFLWPYGWIRYVGFIYGVLILSVAVLTGWHYLLDIFSGIGIALMSLWISRYFLYSWLRMHVIEDHCRGARIILCDISHSPVSISCDTHHKD